MRYLYLSLKNCWAICKVICIKHYLYSTKKNVVAVLWFAPDGIPAPVVKDFDFDQCQLVVCEGKVEKNRLTMQSSALVEPEKTQIAYIHKQPMRDLKQRMINFDISERKIH